MKRHAKTFSTYLGSFALLAGLSTGCAGCIDTGEDNQENITNQDAPDPDTCTDRAGNDISGGVTLNGGCYNITGSIRITSGHLEIAPGTTLYFASGQGLEITQDGSISAVGTAENPIRLYGREALRGYWKGVSLRGIPSTNNELEHLHIAHAGSERWQSTQPRSQAGLVVRGDNTRVRIENLTLRHNQEVGLGIVDAGANVVIDHLHFVENDSAIDTRANALTILGPNLTFQDNDAEFINITDGDLNADLTWIPQAAPYRITRTIRIGNDAHVEILAGTELVFASEVGLHPHQGTLAISGTEDAPVRMRGQEPERGYWLGVEYRNSRSTQNQVDYLILEDAGSSRWQSTQPLSEGGLVVRQDSRVNIQNSTFRNNRFAGVSLLPEDGNTSLSSSLFENNQYPIQTVAAAILQIAADNQFEGNDNQVVNITHTNRTIALSGTIDALSIPYRLDSSPQITGSGNNVVIAPGAAFLGTSHAGIEVTSDATLEIRGEASDPIVFRGEEETAGFWRGIRYNGTRSSSNVVDHVEIHHAGSQRWQSTLTGSDAALVIGADSSASINNLAINQSGGFAISVLSGSEVTGCNNIDTTAIAEGDLFYTHPNVTNSCL